jgi:hypothetical protein
MKNKSKEQTLTAELRDTLKTIMQNEIEKLPETLEQIEPKERVNVICKLMPFVFPKLNTISATEGEPLQW